MAGGRFSLATERLHGVQEIGGSDSVCALASACGSCAAQVVEYAVDGLGFGDEGNYAHLLAAARTCERVHLEDSSQQLCPSTLCLAYGFGLV